MNIALWIFAAVLAALFLASGTTKIAKSREQLIAGGYAWVEDCNSAQVKMIGALEIAGATGLIVPAAFGEGEVITPSAASGLALLMIGAVLTHVRRGETKIAVNLLVLVAVPAALAVLRFGPYSF